MTTGCQLYFDKYIRKIILLSILQILMNCISRSEKREYLCSMTARRNCDTCIANNSRLIPRKQCIKINAFYNISKKTRTRYCNHRGLACKRPFFYFFSFYHHKNLYIITTNTIMLNITNSSVRNFPHVLRVCRVKMYGF